MAQIGIADKNTLDAVKTKVDNYLDASVNSRATQVIANTVNTNVGSNSDGASASGSVHAKIKSARTAIDAIKTKTDSYLDATVSTRATQTTLNTVNSNVGSNANAASATGSVHAKLKDVRSYISSLVSQIRNRTQTITYAEADKDSLTTVRSVSGSGYFSVFSTVIQLPGSFKITVDSSVLLNNKELFNGGSVTTPGSSGFPIVINMRYNSSYKVEHKGELVRTWVQEAAD